MSDSAGETSENVVMWPDWLCPVCFSNTNSQGEQFFGSRAVALHVAGKIRSGDSSHRRWAFSKAGDILNGDTVKRSINTLAEPLEQYVSEYNKSRWQQDKERIERLVRQRMAKEDPGVMAYEHIKKIETNLHQFVRQVLQFSFGEEEAGWWVRGVPLPIRQECAKRCEEDAVQEEKYKYTDLVDLETIIDRNWGRFAPFVSQVPNNANSKRDLLSNIVETNKIRRRVMHPIRSEVSNEELSFLEGFSKTVDNFVKGVY